MKLINIEQTGLCLVNSILKNELSVSKLELSLTVKDTFQKPLVRSVFKGDNGAIGFTFVNAMAKRFVDSFGFSTKLSPGQIEMLTVDTLENFNYESIEDIILFFKMARSGKLGATGRGVDSNLIFGEWFPKYMELKAEERERMYEKEKNERASKTVTIEDVKKTYSEIEKNNFKKKVVEHVDKITKDIDRQMLEDLILDWEKDEQRKPYVRLLKAKRKSV